MILNDHETTLDLLNTGSISSTIVKLIEESRGTPITIGVHGDWGAGKSSVLAMIESQFEGNEHTLCLRFNGWQFQGFGDCQGSCRVFC